ncbi:MAG: hypothetical protein HKL80_06925 [Acidimicrobiales bacterium]|nr:hypothetical protein [Acidimicrobiales bacterium]
MVPGAGTPVVANNMVFVGSKTGVLYAFDSSGTGATCTYNSPSTCKPIFTATPNPNFPIVTTPVVANNNLYVSVENTIYVYDAMGVTNCSGTPVVCSPLWVASVASPTSNLSTPFVSNGYIYAYDAGSLYTFSANGTTNCTGAPLVCSPLWTAPVGSGSSTPPNGTSSTIFMVSQGKLYAFSANGTTNCTGAPLVCSPLWTGEYATDSLGISLSGNIVYTAGKSIYAYDANGLSGCSGTPVICSPLTQYSDSNSNNSFISPATVANGYIYGVTPSGLDVFNLNTTTTCANNGLLCLPNFTAPMSVNYSTTFAPPAPTVVSDVVFVASDSGYLDAFSANGSTNCTGSPLICKPLVSRRLDSAITSTPVANSTMDSVFVTTSNGNFYDLGQDAYMYANTGAPITNISASPFNLNVLFNSSNTDYALYCTNLTNPISITVSSSTGNLSIGGTTSSSFTFNINLEPNQAFSILSPNPNTSIGQPPNVQYWIRCLPPGFPTYAVNKPGHVSNGYYLINSVHLDATTNYYLILNKYGSPVWYHQVPSYITPNLFKLIAPDTLLLSSYYANVATNTNLSFFNMDSQVSTPLYAPSGRMDSHDYAATSNGDRFISSDYLKVANYSSLGYSSNQTYVDNVIQELSASGQIVWQWDPANHICPAESDNYISYSVGPNTIDPLHLNSFSLSPDGKDLLVSFRNLSAVYDINIQTGKILWKLGGNNITCDGEQHLAIANDPETTISGQHDAKFISNDEVTLYDDHTAMSGASRGIEYKIDTTTNTATMIWEYQNPSGSAAIMTGSLYRYDNGNDNLICWGATGSPGYTEVDANGNLLESVTFPGGFNGYRAYKYPTSSISLSLIRNTAGEPDTSSYGPTNSASTSTSYPPHLVSTNSYTPLSPTRIVDTRAGSGYFGQGVTLTAKGSLNVPITSLASIPQGATSVVLNVTATDTTQASFFSANPGTSTAVGTSILNWSQPNETIANLVTLPIGKDGSITFINGNGMADLVIDLEGYYGYAAPGSGILTPIPQTRLVDTRANSGYLNQGQTLGSKQIITVQATGNASVPSSGVSAVILNVTAINSGNNSGYLTLFPASPVLNSSQISVPFTSNLNWNHQGIISNQVIVPVGPTGAINVFNSLGNTDVVIDVEGYFSDGTNPLSDGSELVSMPSTRIIDTRSNSGYLFSGMTLAPGSSIVLSPGSIPSMGAQQVTALLMNLTVTDISGPGYVSATPYAEPPTISSNVNFSTAGDIVSDSVVTPTGTSNEIQITNHGTSSVDIVVDLEGYFVPNLE